MSCDPICAGGLDRWVTAAEGGPPKNYETLPGKISKKGLQG
jgi:hypothetical protein